MHTFTTEIPVRGYELDSLGHVNNAVYMHYLEIARWDLAKKCLGSVDYFKKLGMGLVVARVEMDYREPCFLDDHLIVKTQITELTKRILELHHVIYKRDTDKIVAEAKISAVPIELSTGKSTVFPLEALEKLKA